MREKSSRTGNRTFWPGRETKDELYQEGAATGTAGTRFGVTQEDGTSAQPIHAIETGALSGDEVRGSGARGRISRISMAPGKVCVYEVDPDIRRFQDDVQRVTQSISDSRGVPARHKTSWVGLRRYGRESAVSEGVIRYEDSRLRSSEQSGTLNRLRTSLSQRIPELTQRIFAAPKAPSFFTKKDVTRRQVELHKRIADVFETLPDDDLGNPLGQRAYVEFNRDLVAH
jgi:hypothetical protein